MELFDRDPLTIEPPRDHATAFGTEIDREIASLRHTRL
jgi:hypothetical protein